MSGRIKFLTTMILATALWLVPVMAGAANTDDDGDKAVPAKLTDLQREDLTYIAGYLSNLHTLRADVVQYGSDGSVRMAKLAISRPGKMRLVYDPPVPSLMIADGLFLHYWDAEMQQSSSTPIGDTLAAFLLRDHLKFSGDVTVTKFVRAKGVTEVTLEKTDAPETGDFTLVFEDQPFGLRQWRVRDAEGNVTRVSLQNVETDIKLDDRLFTYSDPQFFKHP